VIKILWIGCGSGRGLIQLQSRREFAMNEESHDKLSAYRTAVYAVGTEGPVQQTVQTPSRLPVSRDTPTAPTSLSGTANRRL
jgi:hypothetical protein